MKHNLTFLLLLLVSLSNITLKAQTNLVSIDSKGVLTYAPDQDGFVIPDFSHAGYKGGGVDLPQIDVVKEISPISGDNTAHIQAAIDEVGKRTADANGFRGALLLKAGQYNISGTLYVKYSGVVIRGEGSGENSANSTIIYATGNTPAQRDVIILGNTSQDKWTTKISGTKKNITDNIVAVGATSFSVTSTTPFAVGDLIIIYHPCNENWLAAVDYGGVPEPAAGDADERWTLNQSPIFYHRYITKIEGKKITIDAPVFYTLNNSLSQSYIYKTNASASLNQIGIENLRIDIESLGGEDENHAWQAIRFRSVTDAWAKNVVTKGFGQSGFITDCVTRSTIENCEAIDPVSIITGERRYNFNTYLNSQLILFKNCYARNGRHHYISNGTASTSGNVFLNCTSDMVNSVNEGHRQWTQGMLFDGHKEQNLKREFVLGLYNRVDMGTGHGWAAVQSVLWNCDVTSSGIIGLQKPPTAQNYAIGCTAKRITGNPVSASNFTIGYVERQNNPVTEIPSLYLAQLNHRLNNPSSLIENKVCHPKTYSIDYSINNSLTIHFSDKLNTKKKIGLFNLQGQKIVNKETYDEAINININNREVYIVSIQIDEKIYTEKIKIQ